MPRKTTKPATSGYIAYYRVSTDRQGESGLGLEAQRRAVAQLAKDAPILAEYTEIESGKKHTNRPQSLAALAQANQHATAPVGANPAAPPVSRALRPSFAYESRGEQTRQRVEPLYFL